MNSDSDPESFLIDDLDEYDTNYGLYKSKYLVIYYLPMELVFHH